MKHWSYIGVFDGLYAVIATEKGDQVRLAFNSDADGVAQMLNQMEKAAAFGEQCRQDDCEGAWIAATIHNEVRKERDRLRAENVQFEADNEAAVDAVAKLRVVLKRLEWSGDDGCNPCCPDCGEAMGAGHAAGCELNAILAAEGGR